MCLGTVRLAGQSSADNAAELSRVSRDLEQTKAELAESRRQIEALRQGLDELRAQVQTNHPAVAEAPPPAAAEPTTEAADQDVAFLAAKIREQHQAKVESGSKYPVKISGLILFNAYNNNGSTDIVDLPNLTFPREEGSARGDLGATLRQSSLTLEVNGPRVFGAASRGDVTIDFSGGSLPGPYGVTAGFVRMRRANAYLNWKDTTLHIGQDTPFFSPLSPTSYATVQQPAFSWAGNLWVWTPGIDVQQRVALRGSDTSLVLRGGILDPLTEEPPGFVERDAGAGEQAHVPALAGRIGLERSAEVRFPLGIGFAGYRARQRHFNLPQIDSWTMNADFKIPLGNHFEVSGEWYQGQAVGGLGGGIWTSVVYPDKNYSAIQPLHSTGGWAQLKFIADRFFEINGAMGQDENEGKDLRVFPKPVGDIEDGPFKKNKAEFVNFIYRPNSVLLFALEYRHMETTPAVGLKSTAGHINLAVGVRF
jgi:hypothetical protein